MKRLVLIFVIFMFVDSAIGKTTYIPKYRTYIHIVNGSDTIVKSNNLRNLELSSSDNMFRMYVEHEDVTNEKVKAIKRAKRAAGWATFSTVMSGISTAFSDNSLQYLVRSTNTIIAGQLAEIYKENANAEQKLMIDLWMENTTEEELMINDMERGLTWYVSPSQFFHFQLNNPDVLILRISDVHNNQVRYAMIATGSQVYKKEIEWEDKDCWISGIWGYIGFSEIKVIEKYVMISKTDFSEREMSIEEFKAYKKETKGKR